MRYNPWDRQELGKIEHLTHTHTHIHTHTHSEVMGFLGGLVGEESTCNVGDAGDMDLISGLRRSTGEGNSNPLQYSCPENPMDNLVGYSSWGCKESDLI